MNKLYKVQTNNEFKLKPKKQTLIDPNFINLILFNDNYLIESTNINLGDFFNNDMFASVSGEIIGYETVYLNNKKHKSIKIKNNFYDIKKVNKQSIKTKKDLLELLKVDSIYHKLNKPNIKNIVINAIHDEPYTWTNDYILNENSEVILDVLDSLKTILKTNNNLVILKTISQSNIETFLSQLGRYPSIKLSLLDNYYLVGRNNYLLQKLNLKLEDTLVLSPKEVMDIYYYINYGYKNDTTYFTIIDMLKNESRIIHCKNHITINELINNELLPYKSNISFIKNGLMAGLKINKNEIIDFNTESIVIIDNIKELEKECINCGTCNKVCHLNLYPIENMKSLKANLTCDDCGLCTYFCPANINLRKYLRGENDNE